MTDLVPRLRLSALWAALMFFCVYADILSFYQPGELEDAIAGKLGPYAVTQTSLFTAAMLMAPPALMVAVTLLLPTALCRWVNVGMGALYTLVNIGNLVGESRVYYLFFGVLEAVLTVSIAVFAYLWLRPGASTT